MPATKVPSVGLPLTFVIKTAVEITSNNVAAEYFFERPGVMRRKHPVLYEALERVFRQDLRARIRAFGQELQQGRPSFGRNSPCPCGSGKKFKKCCLH